MLGLAVTGCATEAAETPEPRTTGTPVPTTEVRSTARSADAAAPPELAGTWRRVVQGEEVLLSLRDTGYRIQRAGEMGSGSITAAKKSRAGSSGATLKKANTSKNASWIK